MHIHFTGSSKIVRKWAKGGAGLVCRLTLNNKHRMLCSGGKRERLYLQDRRRSVWIPGKTRPSPSLKTLHLMHLSPQNKRVLGQTCVRVYYWKPVNSHSDMFRLMMTTICVLLLPMLPGEGLDERHTLSCLLNSSGINNAHRQAFTGFWFVISKGRRKSAACSLNRVAELHFQEMSLSLSLSLSCDELL